MNLPFASRSCLFLLGALAVVPACRARGGVSDGDAAIVPPVAPRSPVRTRLHGEERVDAYAWLRERDDPRTRAYLDAENRYTGAMMRHTRTLQQKLFDEMLARIVEDDSSLPVVDGPYAYLTHGVKGKPYIVFARKPVGADGRLGAEQVIVDGNVLAAGHEYFAIGAVAVSEDHRKVAIGYDTEGDELQRVRVMDIDSGAVIEEFGEDVGAVEWANDGKTLFYTRQDEAHRPWQLWRHRVGTRDTDVLVHQEDDEMFSISVQRTRSDAFVVMSMVSQITAEHHILPADQPEGEFVVIEPREKDVLYTIDHHGDRLFVLTNHRDRDFEVMTTPAKTPGRAHWTSFATPPEGGTFEGTDAFAGHLVIAGRANGLPQLWVHDLEDGGSHPIDLQQPAYAIWLDVNVDFSAKQVRIGFTSPTTPTTIYDYDLETRERVERKRDPVPGFDGKDIVTERVQATAKDGAKVPISIVRRRDAPSPAPLVLQGYGAYGAPNEAVFSRRELVLLERGVTVAIAHVRGGGELGRQWYEQGKFLHKKNTFTDFIACAEFLIAEGYADPKRLAIEGGSAGGLLVAAATNMRPDLFRVVVANVPFVDVVNTMLDASLPLVASEWEEWGNPEDPEFYRYMRSYSPYDNVRAQAYPDMLVLAGWNDPRVGYWEPAKWVAKLRAMKTDNNVLLLRTNMDAGHGGASGRYGWLREEAFVLAFLLDRLGIEH